MKEIYESSGREKLRRVGIRQCSKILKTCRVDMNEREFTESKFISIDID